MLSSKKNLHFGRDAVVDSYIRNAFVSEMRLPNVVFKVKQIPRDVRNKVLSLDFRDKFSRYINRRAILFQFASLRILQIKNCDDEELFSMVCSRKTLQVLKCEEMYPCVRNMSALQNLLCLQKLTMSFFFTIQTCTEIFEALGHCTKLSSLHVSSARDLNPDALKHLYRLPLTNLSLCSMQVDDEILRAICPIYTLQILDIRNTFAQGFSFEGLQTVCTLAHLQHILIGDADYKRLSEIGSDERVKKCIVMPGHAKYIELLNKIVSYKL